MNLSHIRPESLAPEGLGLRMVFSACRGITRRQFWITLGFGFALFNYYSVVMDPPGDMVEWVLRPIFALAAALTMLLAVVVADRATGMDPDRRGTYALAVLTGGITGGLLIKVASWVRGLLFGPVVIPGLGAALYIGLEIVMLGGGIVWMRNDRIRARRAQERTHAAELERIAAEKRSIESDLQAMQARVEPQFLFNTLAQVRDLYRVDVARGERMLDELIAYLRAAMPLMRDTSSTVGQEIALARAYLDIVRLRLGDRLSVDIEAPPGADEIRMPPMMLLPLIDHAIVHGLERASGSGTIRFRAQAGDGRLRLAIFDSGVGFAPESGGDIATLRERLEALYGGNARLELRRADRHASEAVLDLPLEARGSVEELLPQASAGTTPPTGATG